MHIQRGRKGREERKRKEEKRGREVWLLVFLFNSFELYQWLALALG